ncbi:hypothetical protein JD79_04370 [Geodermatophilus normandii]|uniref:Uncharacterized protein n=1 Tax=Geodermatophilus normandii TaxID=1137989 RepID=A0A317QP71_9ACTN|nr:hypothetical protein [Geodermatophilus normandii]PWW25172.1 hypothetical protein JD79_04370 [Geodermatophilus normandii]
MGLGINKDLEPLARAVERRGGTVTVTGSNHLRWILGEWTYMTGLTMSGSSAHACRRDIERHLASLDAPVGTHVVVGPDDRGKFEVHHPNGPVRNANGYARTFSTRDAAKRAAHSLDRRSV